MNADDFDLALVGATADATVVVGDAGDADDSTYTVTVNNVAGDGTLGLDIDTVNVDILDLAGNALNNTPTNDEEYTIDNTAPTVAITRADANPTNADTVVFNVNFSEDVQNVNADDFDLALVGATADATVVVGDAGDADGSTYTVTVNNVAGDGTLGLDIDTVNVDILDLAGNALNNTPTTDEEYTVDNTAPTVAITRADANPTNADTVVFNVNFSEDVQNVNADDFDLALAGATADATVVVGDAGDADDSTYTVTVNNVAGDGTLGLAIDTGNVDILDLAGNALNNTPTTDEEYTIDNTAPTVAITRADANPTNADTVVFNVNFSEDVQNVNADDFDLALAGATADATVVVGDAGDADDSTYTVTVNNVDGDGTLGLDIDAVNVDILDLAGNALNNTPTTDEEYTVDNTAPLPVITATQTSPSNADPINVTINFGEAVTDFVIGDINIGNGAAGNFQDVGNGVFTIDLTPDDDGVVTVDIAANVARDQAGNDNQAANQFSITSDQTAPTITSITSTTADGTYGVGEQINVTVNFSETVTLAGGTLDVTLDTGDVIAIQPFAGASATATYTVGAGDASNDLDATAVALNGGTLVDDAGNNTDTTLPNTTIADGSDIVISAPIITNPDRVGILTVIGGGDSRVQYGTATDTPLAGDFNGDGKDDVGIHRFIDDNGVQSRFLLDTNDNGVFEPNIDARFNFGATGDIPVVGDWNGSGTDKIGVKRGDRFLLDVDGNGAFNDPPDTIITFSPPNIANATPLIGDWNGDGVDDLGAHFGDTFYLDLNGNGVWDGAAGGDAEFVLGQLNDEPIAGDWNGDGTDEVGVHRENQFHLDLNGDRVLDVNDIVVFFGNVANDKAVIGDWNNDGVDDLGVRRGQLFLRDANGTQDWEGTGASSFELDSDGDGTLEPGDLSLIFGVINDVPLAGDFNGDGVDDLGVQRGRKFLLDANGNRDWDTPAGGDRVFNFGLEGDTPLVGDWNGNGIDTVGVHRGDLFLLDVDGDGAFDPTGVDLRIQFGNVGDLPVVGDWNGDGTDTIGVYRIGEFFLDVDGDGVFNPANDVRFNFGQNGDRPLAGDWNDDGISEVGLHRGNEFLLDVNGDRLLDLANGDVQIQFGQANNPPLVGNWDAPPRQRVAPSSRNRNIVAPPALTAPQLAPIVAAATELLIDVGLTPEETEKLQSVEITTADLPNDLLGQTTSHEIVIDATAAGIGWFVDPTPLDNEEFTRLGDAGLVALADGAAEGQMDLLSVVLHELGDLLELDHNDSRLGEVMEETIGSRCETAAPWRFKLVLRQVQSGFTRRSLSQRGGAAKHEMFTPAPRR